MKSAQHLASQWDGKPFDRPEDIKEAVKFFKTVNPQSGKAAEGIAHCLRLIGEYRAMFDSVAPVLLDYLGRHGLGRPALRLMTAHLIATDVEPETALSIKAGHAVAVILDDPHNLQRIKPLLRLQAETAITHSLGFETKRGRSALAAALMIIVSDNNLTPRIPTRDKRDHLEFLEGGARAYGLGGLWARVAEVKEQLEFRARVPRRHQSGSGVFYPIA